MGIAGRRWYLPINGTKGSKATITTLMTQGPKAPFIYTGTSRRGTRRLESITPEWMPMKKYKIAVLDDYRNVALESADWSVLRDRADIAVFDIEPLPPSHPFRTLDNVLATPHIGYVSHRLYKTFYEDTVSNIRKWLDTH